MFNGVHKENLSDLWEWIYSPEECGGEGNLLQAWMPFGSSGDGKEGESFLFSICISLYILLQTVLFIPSYSLHFLNNIVFFYWKIFYFQYFSFRSCVKFNECRCSIPDNFSWVHIIIFQKVFYIIRVLIYLLSFYLILRGYIIW